MLFRSVRATDLHCPALHAMAPVDQLTSNGAVNENRTSQKNRTSSPAPHKLVDATAGGSDALLKKSPAKTDPKEPTSGSSKTRGVRMLGLMLGMVIALGLGVHLFFGIPSLKKVGLPFEGAMIKNRKTMGMVICGLVGLVTAAFFGKRAVEMRKQKAP